jgi:hypothetical protein
VDLVELRRRMEDDPNLLVTLTEGCCMVCDPCRLYHEGEHLCHHAHSRNSLRDLMLRERLGLPPGATLPTREVYRPIADRLSSLEDVCHWGEGLDTAPFWSCCGGTGGCPVLRQNPFMAWMLGA